MQFEATTVENNGMLIMQLQFSDGGVAAVFHITSVGARNMAKQIKKAADLFDKEHAK